MVLIWQQTNLWLVVVGTQMCEHVLKLEVCFHQLTLAKLKLFIMQDEGNRPYAILSVNC